MTSPTITSSAPSDLVAAEGSEADDPARIAAAFYAAYLLDDIAAASAHLAPDAVLHVPGSNPVSGDHAGLDGILGWVLASQAITADGSVTTRLVDVTGGASHATAICEVTGERPGHEVMHNRTIHVLRIEHGRIAEIWFHNWDQVSVDAFWS